MSKTFGIASKLLGEPKKEEDAVKYKVNCEGQPDPDSPISSISHKVLFPAGKAKSKNIVTLRGGAVIKVSLKKELEAALDKVQKDKIDRFIKGVAVPRVENQFSFDINNQTDYIKKVVLRKNKLLLNISEQSKEIEEVGNYYISGYNSNDEDQDVKDFTDFKIYLDASRVRNKKIKRVFRFGFIPFEVIKSLTIQTADKAEQVGILIDGGVRPKDLKEDMESITDETAEEVIKNAMTFVCPVHKLSRSDVLSSDDTVEQIGYFTYYKKDIFFVIPDMSLEDSQGASLNFYNLGDTKSSFRYYLALEAVLFRQISYSPISYAPPPAPSIADNILEEIQSSESFALDLSKDGLVGGTAVHFGLG